MPDSTLTATGTLLASAAQPSLNQMLTPLPPGAELIEPKDAGEKKENEEPNIYLNFENASLSSVVNYLGEQKKINIIPHKELEATKVALTTRNPLTLDRAWNILLTLLEMNGFSMIKVANIYRVVPNKDNGFEPLPTYSSATGTEPESLPESDLVVRYIYFFKNIKVEMADGILKSMLDEKGVRTNKDLNACILKDQCFNIKAAMRILKELDLGGLREQIKIIPLKYATAETVYNLFKDILQLEREEKTIRFAGAAQKERTYFSSDTKMYPDPVKNTLILLGSEKNLDKITEFIYKHIDVPLVDAESRLHIYELRYAVAEQLKPILEGIIKSPAEKSPLVGEYKFFEDVIISAERTSGEGGFERGGGNRLIIACGKDDWRRLVDFIKKLDKPQPQVALEVMFIDIEADVDCQLGAQTFGFKGKTNLGLGTTQAEFLNLSSNKTAAATKEVPNPAYKSDSATPGVPKTILVPDVATQYIQLAGSEYEGQGHPTFITLGRPGDANTENIWSIIKARYNVQNSHIISQPYVVTNNNQKCTVEVKRTRLVPGALDSKKGEPSIQKQDTIQASTAVNITPRINLEGVVDLEVDISVNEFTDTVVNDAPTTLKREMKTRSTLFSGEVLVLGGLTKSNDTDSTYKTPILGDLPIIGNLFKNKSKRHIETNLYIFIRPSIIKPRFEGGADEYSQLKLDYAKYQMMKNDTFAKEHDPIQRWFFRPTRQTARQALLDRAKGVFRPIDEFAYGKSMPKSVIMEQDPYFKVSEAIAEKKKEIERTRKKKRKRSRSRKPATIKLQE